MKLHPQHTGNANIIRAYDERGVTVNDEVYHGSLVVSRSLLLTPWEVGDADSLQAADLLALLQYQPEIILLGTGQRHRMCDPRISAEVMQHGTGIEIMSTDAACRTYNVLLGEDRNVLAALIIGS